MATNDKYMLPPSVAAKVVEIDYTNHRGERRTRRILPVGLAFKACPPWHPEPGWILGAADLDKQEHRDFAMSGIHGWRVPDESGRDEAGERRKS